MKSVNGGFVWVKVSLKYIFIDMIFDFSESINNMGKFCVDVFDVSDFLFVDCNGKSDLYCKFEFNGNEVYKMKVQKKILYFVWNEFFEVVVFF